MDDKILDRIKTTKFLGVHFDENFTWEYHVDYCKKKGNFAINSSQYILNEKHLKILYYSPGIIVWSTPIYTMVLCYGVMPL